MIGSLDNHKILLHNNKLRTIQVERDAIINFVKIHFKETWKDLRLNLNSNISICVQIVQIDLKKRITVFTVVKCIMTQTKVMENVGLNAKTVIFG